MYTFETNYMSISLAPEESEEYKGYMSLSAKDNDPSKFFMEIHDKVFLETCKKYFPDGDPRLEDWSVVMEIVKDEDKLNLPDLIQFVKSIEKQFLLKVKDQ